MEQCEGQYRAPEVEFVAEHHLAAGEHAAAACVYTQTYWNQTECNEILEPEEAALAASLGFKDTAAGQRACSM